MGEANKICMILLYSHMTDFKTFSKVTFDKYVQKYGFSDVEDAAFIKLVLAIEVMVTNIINNALHVAGAMKVKTLKKEHFMAVLNIMRDCATNSKDENHLENMRGGRVSLPSEYFSGEASGRYFENVSAFESQTFGPNVTKYGLDIKVPELAGGAADSSMLSKDQIKVLIQNVKTKNKLSFRVSLRAYSIITMSVLMNLDLLLKMCKREARRRNLKSKALTTNLLFSVLKRHHKLFSHMSYVWKN
jgi:hypothetical protein